jgi:hypothetical protein
MLLTLLFTMGCSHLSYRERSIASELEDKEISVSPEAKRVITEIDQDFLKAFIEIYYLNEDLLPDLYAIDYQNGAGGSIIGSSTTSSFFVGLTGVFGGGLFSSAIVMDAGSHDHEMFTPGNFIMSALAVGSSAVGYMGASKESNSEDVIRSNRRAIVDKEIGATTNYFSKLLSLKNQEKKQFKNDLQEYVIRQNKKNFNENMEEWVKLNIDEDIPTRNFDILSIFESSNEYTSITKKRVSALRSLQKHLVNNRKLQDISKEKYRRLVGDSSNEKEFIVHVLDIKSNTLDSLIKLADSKEVPLSIEQKASLAEIIDSVKEVIEVTHDFYN